MLDALRARPLGAGLATGVALTLVPYPVAGSPPPGSSTVHRWLIQDHLGSAVLVVSAAGTVVHRRVFEPYGQVHAQTTPSEPTRQLFTDQEYSAGAQLYDFDARWYDSGAGRFISIDPMIRDLQVPQSGNAFSYAEGRPLNGVDSTGLYFEGWSDFSFALVFGLSAVGAEVDAWKGGRSTQSPEILAMLSNPSVSVAAAMAASAAGAAAGPGADPSVALAAARAAALEAAVVAAGGGAVVLAMSSTQTEVSVLPGVTVTASLGAPVGVTGSVGRTSQGGAHFATGLAFGLQGGASASPGNPPGFDTALERAGGGPGSVQYMVITVEVNAHVRGWPIGFSFPLGIAHLTSDSVAPNSFFVITPWSDFSWASGYGFSARFGATGQWGTYNLQGR